MKKTILISILLSLLPVFAIAAGHKSDEDCHHKHSDHKQKHESSYHDDEEDNKDSDEPKKREYRSSYY